MPDLSSPETAYYAIALTTPAIVFVFVRVQFIHGRMPNAGEAALHYVAITSAYYAIAFPIIFWANQIPGNEYTWWGGWLLLTIFAPACLGLIFGWSAQKNFLYNFLRKVGLKPIHISPTAWEWRFSHCAGEWVAITLKNGNAYGAICGENSFVSTSPSERDIYLEAAYDINDDGSWSKRKFGMLVCSGEISTIEFQIPTQEHTDG